LTFSVGATHDLLEAAPTLPLRTLDVILNGSTAVTGILDNGCQVVIIRLDVWQKLGAPLKHEPGHVHGVSQRPSYIMMGTLLRIRFTVGDITSLYGPGHSGGSFECLIGQPFTALAQMVSESFRMEQPTSPPPILTLASCHGAHLSDESSARIGEGEVGCSILKTLGKPSG